MSGTIQPRGPFRGCTALYCTLNPTRHLICCQQITIIVIIFSFVVMSGVIVIISTCDVQGATMTDRA